MAAPLRRFSAANRRQLGQMDLLASPSRSGGHAPDEDALRSHNTQERFRAHIEEKLDGLRARFGEMLADSYGELITLEEDKEAYYAILDVLLLLRKLREGIVAAHRKDAFVIEVYETAARLALRTANFTHLVSSLAALVRDLYPAVPVQAPPLLEDAMTDALDGLTIDSAPMPEVKAAYVPPHQRKPAAWSRAAAASPPARPPRPLYGSADDRDVFISVYLILQLSHHRAPASFVSQISHVTGSPYALYHARAPARSRPAQRIGKDVWQPIIRPDAPALVLPRLVYKAYVRSSFALTERLLSALPPVPVHPLERLALLLSGAEQRDQAWRTLRAAYRDVGESELRWLEGLLGLKEGGGPGWLQEKGCERSANGRWLLKTGKA